MRSDTKRRYGAQHRYALARLSRRAYEREFQAILRLAARDSDGPESLDLLALMRRAGAAMAEGAPPLTQAQVDWIVAVLRQTEPQPRSKRRRQVR